MKYILAIFIYICAKMLRINEVYYKNFIFGILINILFLAPYSFSETAFFRPGKYLVKYKGQPENKPVLIHIKTKAPSKRKKRYHRFYDSCYSLKRHNKNITSCSADYIIQAQDDPYVFNCTSTNNCNWAIENTFDTDLDIQQAWQITEGQDVLVAVLDTGVDLTHPDIMENIWTNPNEIPSNGIDDDNNGYIDDIHGVSILSGGTPQDDNGHGTHVSGIIAAVRNNSIGIAGAAPKVKILPVKILDSSGSGDINQAISGIQYLVDLVTNHNIPVFVFNNSWGGGVNNTALLSDAFNAARQAGILATAAAGNGGNDSVGDDLDLPANANFFPAKFTFPNMITVASYDIGGRLSSFSNFGKNSVHIAAPGGRIRSLLASGVSFGSSSENGTVIASGTSMATPYVTAVLALMKAHFPLLSNLEIRDRLLNRVYPLNDDQSQKVLTSGRLNAFYALTDGNIPVPTPLASFTPTQTFTPSPTKTSTPTGTLSPQPTSENTAIPTITPQAENTVSIQEVSAKLSIKPAGQLISSNQISTKKANLIDLEITNKANASKLELIISAGQCELRKEVINLSKSTRLLRLQSNAKKLKNINFTVRKDSNQILFEQLFSVSPRTKSKSIPGCKSLKKGLSLIGSI